MFTSCTTPTQLSWAEHRAMKECGESNSFTAGSNEFCYVWQLPSCFSLHICRVDRLWSGPWFGRKSLKMSPAISEASGAPAAYKRKICGVKKKKKNQKPKPTNLSSYFRSSKMELQTLVAFQPKMSRSRLQKQLFIAIRLCI